MATKKNFIEKGRRADPMGSNPHSYGLDFSAYKLVWGNQNAIRTNKRAKEVLVISVNMKLIILSWVYTKFGRLEVSCIEYTKRI